MHVSPDHAGHWDPEEPLWRAVEYMYTLRTNESLTTAIYIVMYMNIIVYTCTCIAGSNSMFLKVVIACQNSKQTFSASTQKHHTQ